MLILLASITYRKLYSEVTFIALLQKFFVLTEIFHKEICKNVIAPALKFDQPWKDVCSPQIILESFN
ncbi:hypothetical protein IEQ34_017816 [Dendrobium chrysotoxum]|uniref:Uncharacterized protein n=1 Tax=Dendrobium chrysotoxum TaxID=161865 RepID=A0AAV7GB81_DENCH|nr:hypothetical protein IEQ34_017816 [Dendrobium chrysotoxum]